MPLSADNVFIGIYRRLNEDPTLQGAAYLGGTGHVHLTSIRPDSAPLPAVGLRFIGDSFANQQKGMAKWLLRVNVYVGKATNNEPDSTRAQLIKERVNVLLEDATFTAATGETIKVRNPAPLGSALLDPAARDEHFWILQYEVTAG